MDDSSRSGITNPAEGSTTPQERTRAFQLDMLQVDIDYAVKWLDTMKALVDNQLDHEPFTAQRMAALKAWESSRKLAQARLRSKYNPKRRRADFIDATTREGKVQILENLRQAKLDMEAAGIKRPEWKKSTGRKLEESMMLSVKADIAAEQALPRRPVTPPTPKESAAQYIELVAKLSNVPDVLTASDKRIREGLRHRMGPAEINKLLKDLPDAILVHTGKRRPLIDD